MSKESKIFTATLWNAQETVTHYESFGWELISLNGNQIVMSRESQNPVYPELVKYQGMYEETAAQYSSLQAPTRPAALPSVNYRAAVIGYICLIFPGVLYTVYRVNKKKEYDQAMNEYNEKHAAYQAKRQELLEKMKNIALESRGVFFSRQS